ncbi:DUF1365 domain-containing protein [Hansschlegelia plantiphila]|uniref:DUF1365 domain-containing protein n=1 Tax=Hansschlegelia plantiphila TaxID=374655 RepID=A0A9W6J4G4_9HYPH|nr:DUF1365 domain-containing protein [Hansschlegelia plantiphila]GLK69588.1 DUF1365 domain-containing protein [Hansschlegelia plantiphila]
MTDGQPHFPPPAGAASLYKGVVRHTRLKPRRRRFAYDVFSLLIDLDALDEANRLSRLFSVGRFNLVSFFERDHGAGDGASLSAHARSLLARGGVDLDGGRVLLLCYPRILGYVFNPIATYWCYGADGALKALIYEVTNTFHERHAYVAPVRDGELSSDGLRQSRDKLLYVSPFIEMDMRYAFRLRPPGETVRLGILESDAEGPLLSASFAGDRRDVTDAVIARLCARIPLMTLKVMAAIHWEAARLWIRGARLADHPSPPADAASFDAPGPFSHGGAARRGARPAARRPEPASSL